MVKYPNATEKRIKNFLLQHPDLEADYNKILARVTREKRGVPHDFFIEQAAPEIIIAKLERDNVLLEELRADLERWQPSKSPKPFAAKSIGYIKGLEPIVDRAIKAELGEDYEFPQAPKAGMGSPMV